MIGVLTTLAWGCGHSGLKLPLATSPENPSVRGIVNISRADNHNTKIELKASHLARPDKVAEGATTYVLWARPVATGGQPEQARTEGPSTMLSEKQRVSGRIAAPVPTYNLGALQISDDQQGKITTDTFLHSFDLFVTAEPNSKVMEPSNKQLLWVTVNQP
jgi:hypothetical protein